MACSGVNLTSDDLELCMDARGVWAGEEAAEADLFLLDRLKKDIVGV